MARRFLVLAVFIVACGAAWPTFAQDPVGVTKSSAGPPVAGADASYTVTVRQADGVTAAANVVLTDNVPTNTTFVSAVQSSGPGFACTTPAVGATTGTISCSISALPAGSADAVFVFTFHVAPTMQQTVIITNTANVSTTTTDAVPSDNSASTVQGVVTSADIGVVKTGPSTYTLGTNVTYTITASNAGPSDAQSVNLSDALFSPSVTFVSISQTSGVPFTCTTPAVGSGGNVTCTTATLPAGSSAVFHLVVKSDPRTFVALNTATINSATSDPNNTNNASSFAPATSTMDADLAVTKSGPLTATAGQTITYTITGTNNGPSFATAGGTLSDALPSNLLFQSWTQTSGGLTWGCITPPAGSSGTITCSPPDGNPGTSATFRLIALVASSVANGGSVTNTATYTTATPDSVSSNNSSSVTTTVTRLADLSVSKVAGAGTVNPGGNITYTVVLSNSGPSDAATVVLDDVVPTGTTFVSATQTSGPPFSCGLTSGTIRCTAASVASGAVAQFSFVVQNNTSNLGGTVISNTATASTATPETTLANNNASATVTVTAAGLAITKSGSPNPVQAGTNITYTVTVSNVGTIGAHDATMTDAIPANTTFVSNAQTSGPTFACSNPAVGGTGTISCTNALLAAGASTTFSIVVRVNPTTANGTTITNTANTSTTDTDPNLSNNSTTTTTTVAISADVVVTKTAPATVGPGGNLTYTVTVANSGSSDATGVTLTDTLPAGTTFTSETQTSGPAFSCNPAVGGTGTISCTSATLGAGASATFSIVVNVNAGVGTTITNTASASSSSADANLANNSSSASTVVAGPDLAVTKSDSPDPVVAGSNITYTVTIMNNGTAGANNVSVVDALPASTTFVSNTQTAGTAFACTNPAAGTNGTITCTTALLGAASSATFQIVVQVAAGTAASTIISNTATASTTDTETNTTNNSGTATTTVAAAPVADITVTKSDAPDPVAAGANITYTMTVTNGGSAAAGNVSLADAVPVNTTFVSSSSSQGSCSGTATVTCNLGTIASTASATVTLVVAVGASVPAGTTISNTASVATTSTESTTANNSATASTTVVGSSSPADLLVTKTDSPDPVAVGGNITYTINVTNNGGSAAAAATLTDVLPVGTTFVSFNAPAGWTPSAPSPGASGTVTATNASLAPGVTASFTLVVAVSGSAAPGSTISNTANVATSSPESSTANNSATANTGVGGSAADVSIAKSASTASVGVNGQISYTIAVANAGPSAATSVNVTDPLPSGTTFVSATPTQGNCSGTTSVTCALGTINSGASAQVVLIVTAPATATTVVNTASVSAANDSTASNNSSSSSVAIVNNIPALSPTLLLLLALAFALLVARLLTE